MTSWQTESPSVPAWGDMGHFSQFPLTSLRDVLEASQAQEAQAAIPGRPPVRWADMLRQTGSQTVHAGVPIPLPRGPPLKQQQQPARQTPPPHQQRQQQQQQQQQQQKPDPLMLQAAKSKPDIMTGQIRCLGCGKVCVDHNSLAQHLKDKHQGLNSPNAPGSTNAQTGAQSSRPSTQFSIADVLTASRKSKKAAAKPTESGSSGLSLTAQQLRNVRGLVKAYPTKAQLAQAIKGQLGTLSGKKKLSRLKRVILRERTDKAASGATLAAASATAAAEKAETARAAVAESLQAAEDRLKGDTAAGGMLDPALITQVQVLEMALAEAERRVSEAKRKATQAEEEACKAAEERSKAWKVSIADADKDDNDAALAASPAATASSLAPIVESPAEHSAEAEDHGQQEVAAASPSKPPPAAGRRQKAVREPNGMHGPQIEETEDMEGLQGFEDVLASWVHDASEKASAAMLKSGLDGTLNGEEAPRGSTAPNIAEPGDGTDSLSEADSDALGPDGWDDVLSAWMTNAGVLSAAHRSEPTVLSSTDRTPELSPRQITPPASPLTAAVSHRAAPTGSSSTTPRGAHSPAATTPRKPPLDLSQHQPGSEGVILRQLSGVDAVISPSNRGTATPSPRSSDSTTPHAGSGPDAGLGGRSDGPLNLSRQGSTGLERPGSSRLWKQDRPPSRASDPLPLPLLADVLAGGHLSQDALLDLRVSFADNLSTRSEKDEGMFVARVAGGGAVALPAFPSRHSEGSTQNLPPLRQPDSWGPWAGSSGIQGTRWQDGVGQPLRASLEVRTELPSLHSSLDSFTNGGSASALAGSASERQATTLNLFGRAASASAMADLGLPRLHSVDQQLHGAKLYHNVLTAAQRKMLDDLPAPRNEQAPGEPPLARLPSITRPMRTPPPAGGSLSPPGTALAADSGRGPSWLAAASSDEEGEPQTPLEAPLGLTASRRSASLPSSGSARQPAPAGQQQSPQPQLQGSHRQQHFGYPPQQLPQLDDRRWWAPEQGPEFPMDPMDPAMFRGFPSAGPMQSPESSGMFTGAHMMPNNHDFPGPRRMSADGVLGLSHIRGNMGGLGGVPLPHAMGPFDHQIQVGRGLPGQQSFPMGMPQGPSPGLAEVPMLMGGLPVEELQAQAFRTLLSSGAMGGGLFAEQVAPRLSGLPEWDREPGLPPPFGPGADGSSAAMHEFHCDVCRVTCCGMTNFQQHCNSKKHLRKAAAAGAAAIPDMGSPGCPDSLADDPAEGLQSVNPTYVGLQAQCRTYCKQVISTDMNRVVVELLQNLLFWQERSKAMNAHNAVKKKRLVSGLREVAKAIKLHKAKTVIVTPNIEQIETEGGLDDLLTSILDQATESGTPVVFALSRKKLGQVFGCRKKMSAIAILDYSGAEGLFKEMEKLADQGRQEWEGHHQQEAEMDGDTAREAPSIGNAGVEVQEKPGSPSADSPLTTATAAGEPPGRATALSPAPAAAEGLNGDRQHGGAGASPGLDQVEEASSPSLGNGQHFAAANFGWVSAALDSPHASAAEAANRGGHSLPAKRLNVAAPLFVPRK